MSNIHRSVRAAEQAKAEKMVGRKPHATGGMVGANAVHKHEDHLHKGAPKTKLKKGGRVARKHGGMVPGEKPAARLDKRARGGNIHDMTEGKRLKPKEPQINADSEKAIPNRAHGGRVGKKSGKVNVIINTNGGGDDQKIQAAHQAGMAQGAKMGAAAAAMKPPMGPPPGPGGMPPGPGAPPMGGPPPGMPPMHARGGKIAKDPIPGQLAARDSGPGRLTRMEKTDERKGEIKVKAHTRKRGGAC